MTATPSHAHATAATWPSNDAERVAFADWQNEVSNGDTHIGFRQWLDVMSVDDPDTYATYTFPTVNATVTQEGAGAGRSHGTGAMDPDADGPTHWDPQCPGLTPGEAVITDLSGIDRVSCDQCVPAWEVEFTVTVCVAAADADAAYTKARPIALAQAAAGDLSNYDECVSRLKPGLISTLDLRH